MIAGKSKAETSRCKEPETVWCEGQLPPKRNAIYENVSSQATNMIAYSYKSSFQAVQYCDITLVPYSIAHVEQDPVALPSLKPP